MKKLPMIVMMSAPYFLLGLFLTDAAALPRGGIAFAIVMLLGALYAFYLAKTDCSGHRIVLWCMVLKLCNVPVFLLIFLVAAGFFVMMLPLIPFLVLFDYFLLLSTSMYGISGLLKCGKEGRLSGKAVAMNIVFQFVFCADVLCAVYCCFKTREKADSNE